MYTQCTQITIYMYCKATVHVNPIKYSIILHLEWENQGSMYNVHVVQSIGVACTACTVQYRYMYTQCTQIQCTCSSINWCGMYSMYSTVQIHVHTMYTNTMYM